MSPSTPYSMEPRPIALVTGASAGIGKAIVRRLLRDGWVAYGAGTFSLSMDVTDDSSMVAAVDQVPARHGLLPEGAWGKMIAMAVR